VPERGDGDWFADAEGNLTAPGELKPDTDEFGRDDPATLERERRRREREQRRQGRRKKKAEKPKRGRRKERPPRQAPAPTAEAPPKEVQPTGDGRGSRAAAGARAMGDRAAAGRDALRRRISRDGSGRAPRTFRRRRFAALVLVLVGILLTWFLVAFFQPFAGDGEGGDPVTVEIPENASAGEIADILDEAGVISSAQLFEWRLRLAGKADEVQADSYTLASGMSYGTAIDKLTGGDAPSGAVSVSIPEGLDRRQIAAQVLPEGVSSDDYLAQTETAPNYFDPTRYGAKSRGLEGFLFPATYELQAGSGAVPSLIKQQLQAFKDNIARVDLSYAKKKNLTAYDVVIIASMIDKEVQVAKERDDVAAVIYNRLSKGIPLGIDATTRYETNNYTEPITQAQLDADTPYNTRLNAGLTPTPIGNPGLDALRAAAKPAKVNYLYFVVDPCGGGKHFFTASEAEFEAKAAEYQQALEAQGGSPTDC
jgi:uncharacterized YceG family protein